MAEWKGWSDDWADINVTRVLAGLMDSVQHGVTTATTDEVVTNLSVEIDGREAFIQFDRAGLFEETTIAPTQDTQTLSVYGDLVRDEFRAAQGRAGFAKGARSALIRWLYERDAIDGSIDPSNILGSPQSWFYGRQFTQDQIDAAARNLDDRGYVTARGSAQGTVLRVTLTTLGVTCAEDHDGDPDAMERQRTMGGNHFSIGQYTQNGGSAAFQSKVGSQTSTVNQLTMGQTSADLVAILQAIRRLPEFPEDELDEALAVEQDLTAAGSDDHRATAAVGRARQFAQQLATKLTDPMIQTLAVAAGNYAALRLGLPQG